MNIPLHYKRFSTSCFHDILEHSLARVINQTSITRIVVSRLRYPVRVGISFNGLCQHFSLFRHNKRCWVEILPIKQLRNCNFSDGSICSHKSRNAVFLANGFGQVFQSPGVILVHLPQAVSVKPPTFSCCNLL